MRREVSPDLFRGVAQKIDEAITEGIADDTPDDDFVEALRHSGEVFSAFKVHRAQNDMAAKLLDSNGALKPFDRWLNDVLPIASHQCGSWLRTEYDTAVIRAQQAAEWKRFERDKDVLPNLKWVPSTSPNPGADHRIYWGTILPVDHPFWSRHRPGDRWNCQCSLESTDEPATGIKHEDAVDPRKNGPQKGLKDNPGKTGNLFGQDHPYYPESCSSCPFAGGLTNRLGMIFRGQKRDCNTCKNVPIKNRKDLIKTKQKNKKHYSELSKNPDYTDITFNPRTGALKARHVGHIIHDDDNAERFFAERLTTTELELKCQDELYKWGHVAILLDESKQFRGKKLAALDIEIDGVKTDIKSITGKGWYDKALLVKNDQLNRYNSREDVSTPADTVCLYFHDPASFNESKLTKSIRAYKADRHKNGKPVLIKKIYVVVRKSGGLKSYEI